MTKLWRIALRRLTKIKKSLPHSLFIIDTKHWKYFWIYCFSSNGSKRRLLNWVVSKHQHLRVKVLLGGNKNSGERIIQSTYVLLSTPWFETLPRKISCGQSCPCCLDDGCGRGSGRGHCPQAEGGQTGGQQSGASCHRWSKNVNKCVFSACLRFKKIDVAPSFCFR